MKLNLGMTKSRTKEQEILFPSTFWAPKQTHFLYISFYFLLFQHFLSNTNKMRKETTNLHAEEDLFLSLELGENGDKIGLEQAGHVGPDEPVEADRVGLKPLELFGHDQTLLAHLLLSSPYRQARARGRAGNISTRPILLQLLLSVVVF
jgi:hypothetical protein